MMDKITDKRFYSILTGSRATRLRELLSEAKPYTGADGVITKERSNANQEFFFLAYDLMPFIFSYVDGLKK